MKLNRTYYKHLWKSIIIVSVGLGLILKVAYPDAMSNSNLFILITIILSAFFGALGIINLIIRFDRGPKYRRKFIYCFLGVANGMLGALSLPFSILHHASIIYMLVYLVVLAIGVIVMLDIFFGKRDVRYEQEVLMH